MRIICLGLLLMTAPVFAQSAEEEESYVRKPKSAAVGVELGMNSLASLVGIKGTFFVTPQVLIDAGLGLSSAGLRPGVYGRYLFSKAKFSPYGYGGFKYALGSGGQAAKVTDTKTKTDYELKVEPSPYVDFGLGFDYLAHSGFNFNMALGWSQLLGGKNYEWVGAQPTQDFDDVMSFVLGSGLALSLSIGYAF